MLEHSDAMQTEGGGPAAARAGDYESGRPLALRILAICSAWSFQW